MGRRVTLNVSPGGLAVAVLAGTWAAHTLEYLRVSSSFDGFSSIHTYMGPVGAVLAIVAVLGVRATARLTVRLRRQLQLGQSAPGGPPGWSVAVPTLLAIVWLWQSGLYLLQENLEALVAHHQLTGFGPLSGVHGAALLVQLAVAALVVGVLWLIRREVTALVAAIARLRRGWSALCGRPRRWTVRAWTPAQRWGMALWSRPPPTPV
jgi:hypothetical protein